ncbi:chymotrypsin inhibitor-like [Zeugodacus cucurbitae]|uniref:chymotrypsin inhibitor-like n=1 Tax=Zeugodacus cucurbitae TaxID=28588 RepID=UPI0023D8ED86|nr:chymotrypsin inhibitor-like [Zeugodacus cucurbitae]
MNTKSCLLFLLVVCIAGFVSTKPQQGSGSCGENEVFRTCGTACPPRCNANNIHVVCPTVCVVECQCIHGYLRNNEGRCVLREDC